MSRVIHAGAHAQDREQVNEDTTSGHLRQWVVPAYTILATAALIALSVFVHDNPLWPFDIAVSKLVQSYHAGWYNLLMLLTGEPGYPPQVYVLVVWIIAVLLLTRLRWEAIMEVFATVGIGVVGLIVKILVNRPRPTPNLVNVITTLDSGKMSYPAGHVESYVAIIGFLWFLSFVACKSPWVRAITLLFFGEMLAVIGISRIYTGEHWMTDTVGGYLLGSLWLILTLYIYQWGKRRRFLEKGEPSQKRNSGS